MLYDKTFNKLISLSNIFNNGFTVEYNNGIISQFNQNKGYIVSYKTLITIKDKNIKINGVIPNKAILRGWSDKDTGIYYIKVNKVFNSLKMALNTARMNNQKVIWDTANNREIRV